MDLAEIKRKAHYWRPQLVYLFFSGKDRNVRNILKYQVASRYLKKKYVDPFFKENPDALNGVYSCKGNEVPKICWLYWRQGFENAPDIVKKCMTSARDLFTANNWQVELLDYDMARKKCDLPEYIWEKHSQGKISDTHLSDLIRLELLTKYGGCWADATIYFSDQKNIPEFFYKRELFLYRSSMNGKYMDISNWLICSQPIHPIIKVTRDILLQYWEKEDTLIEYLAFYLVFRHITSRCLLYWNMLPYRTNAYPLMLQNFLMKPYSEEKLKDIFEVSTVHKLTWKIKETIPDGSFFDCFLKNMW